MHMCPKARSYILRIYICMFMEHSIIRALCKYVPHFHLLHNKEPNKIGLCTYVVVSYNGLLLYYSESNTNIQCVCVRVPFSSNCIDFINEYNGRSMIFGNTKQLSDKFWSFSLMCMITHMLYVYTHKHAYIRTYNLAPLYVGAYTYVCIQHMKEVLSFCMKVYMNSLYPNFIHTYRCPYLIYGYDTYV